MASVNDANRILFDQAAASSHTKSFTVDAADDYLVGRFLLVDSSESINSVTIDPGGANEATFTRETRFTDDEISFVGRNEFWYLSGASVPPAGTYDVQVSTSFATLHGDVVALQGAADQAPEAFGSNTKTFTTNAMTNNELTPQTAGALLMDMVSVPDVGVTITTFSPSNSQTKQTEHSEGRHSFVTGYRTTPSTGSVVEADYSWSENADEMIGIVVSIAPAAGGGSVAPAAHHHRQQMMS